MITGCDCKKKLFLILVFWEQPPRDVIWKLFLKFTFKGKIYVELCHFFFSRTLSETFRTPINIDDGAIGTDGSQF